MPTPRICFRVDFTEWCSIGIGKIELLEAIQRDGSLSQAARAIGMSYRRAWLLVNSMNCAFKTPLVSATTGGIGGGGAVLTIFGEQLVQTYRALELQLAALTERQMRAIARRVTPQDQRDHRHDVALRQSIAKPLLPPIST